MTDNNNKGVFNRFSEWVNADKGLPTLEELENARSHESHDETHDEAHESGGTREAHKSGNTHKHPYKAHDAHSDEEAFASPAGMPAPLDVKGQESDDGVEDDELQYPDEIAAEDKPEEQSAQEQPAQEQPAQEQPAQEQEQPAPAQTPAAQRVKTPPKLNAKQKKRVETFKKLYIALAGLLATMIIAVLLLAVSGSPAFGSPHNPSINEVYERYVEKGMQETGATNIVAAMILDYRAFDTLGESVMLFTATMAVVMLLRETKQASGKKEKEEEA